MTTDKRRGKYAFSDQTWKELDHLHKDHLEKMSDKVVGRIHMRDTLAKLIHDAYVVNKAFGTDWKKRSG